MPNDALQPHNRYRCARRLSCSAAVFHGSVEGMNNDLRHPIGKFVRPATLTPQEREQALQKIAELPKKLRAAVTGLSESQIDTPYRDGGWTVRQTIHHVADSHMQAIARMRLALTEDWPAITPYQRKCMGGAGRCAHVARRSFAATARLAAYALGHAAALAR